MGHPAPTDNWPLTTGHWFFKESKLLKLKKLQILGFKSFCDRTELKFPGTVWPPSRPQRLRQIEYRRRHLMGAGRAVRQDSAAALAWKT